MGRPFFNNKPRETNKKIIRTVEISYLIALDELENSSILFKFQKSVREVCCAGCSSNPKTTSVFKTALTPAPPRTPPAQLRSSLPQGEDVPSKWETPDPAAFRAALADALSFFYPSVLVLVAVRDSTVLLAYAGTRSLPGGSSEHFAKRTDTLEHFPKSTNTKQ